MKNAWEEISCTAAATVLICFDCAAFENEVSAVLMQVRCWRGFYNGCCWHTKAKLGQQICMKWDFHDEFVLKLCTVHKAGWMWAGENKAGLQQWLLLCILFNAVQGACAQGGLEFQSSWQYSLRCEIELQNWTVITLCLLPAPSPTLFSHFPFPPIIPRRHSRSFPLDEGARPNCSECISMPTGV